MMECASVLLVVILVAGWILVVSIKAQNRFEKEHPPISEEEFVARCSAGTNPQVALKVRRIVSDNLGVAHDRIDPSMDFSEDLGAD